MKNRSLIYARRVILPTLLLSALAGILTGAVIFLFKLASSYVISLSGDIYSSVRADPVCIILLLIGAAAIGAVMCAILHFIPDARGGGIPTAIATLRGHTVFTSLMSVPAVFLSSLLTFLLGVPLGTEGPSVQMGTLIGWWVSKLFSKKAPAWERYVMTGGASAGFAAATGAPLTGIIFAFEEAHLRFSPMIFFFASISTAFGMGTVQIFSHIAGISPNLFELGTYAAMPIRHIWIPAAVGIICGIYAVVFTRGYRGVERFMNKKLSALPFIVKVIVICVIVAACGFFSAELIGTGHSIVEEIIHGDGVWYVLLIIMCVRVILLLFANVTGITGGLFVPSLAFGAIIGGLCAKLLCYVGVMESEYYVAVVIVGIAAFLSASSRTPLMAIAFAIEALGAFNNALPVVVGVMLAFVVVETSRVESFTDTVIEKKIETLRKNRRRVSRDVAIVVGENSFAAGKEIRDILWPPSCVVVSVDNNPATHTEHGTGLEAGDVLHIHFSSPHPNLTQKKLEEIISDRK